jgi:hypothetical protein
MSEMFSRLFKIVGVEGSVRNIWGWWEAMSFCLGLWRSRANLSFQSVFFMRQHPSSLVISDICWNWWHVIKKVKPETFFKVDQKCRENLKVFKMQGLKLKWPLSAGTFYIFNPKLFNMLLRMAGLSGKKKYLTCYAITIF